MAEKDDGERIRKQGSAHRIGKPVKNIKASSRQVVPDAINHSSEDRNTMPGKDSQEVVVSGDETDAVSIGSARETVLPAGSGNLPRYADRIVPHAIIEMLNHRNEKVRIEAIESLLKIGDRSLGYAFTKALADDSFRVRLGALRGLYKCGGDMVADQLIQAVQDSHPDVRRRALIYLGWMRKKELVPYVAGALSDTSALVRKVATYALGDIKDSASVPYLIKALEDKDQEVVKGALAALKRIAEQSFQSALQSPEAVQRDLCEQWKTWWKTKSRL